MLKFFFLALNAATYEHVGFVVSVFSAFLMKIDYSTVSFSLPNQKKPRQGKTLLLDLVNPFILTH